jgi:hypothetical protein
MSACVQKNRKSILVKNLLDSVRFSETVELTKDFLKVEELNDLGIRDVITGEIQVSQLVDINGDGTMDVILFQPKIEPKSEKQFEIINLKGVEVDELINAPELCYSRFVPERTDDYTWENNRVAFRVYGPTAQKMVEEGAKGGTLSSGVDAWLKKVEFPIINKWYKKETETIKKKRKRTGVIMRMMVKVWTIFMLV